MFERFFYLLRDRGVPVSPTSFIQLQKALSKGLIRSLDDFYVVARAVMVKRARHFDLYDQVFGHYFKGKEWPNVLPIDHSVVRQWLTRQCCNRWEQIQHGSDLGTFSTGSHLPGPAHDHRYTLTTLIS